MNLSLDDFENHHNIPLVFYELDENTSNGLLRTKFNMQTNGRIDLLIAFHKPIANLPLSEKLETVLRDEIF